MKNNSGPWLLALSLGALLLTATWFTQTARAGSQTGVWYSNSEAFVASVEPLALGQVPQIFFPSVVKRPVSAGKWEHLSSVDGEIPTPLIGEEQVLALILDVDRDDVNDFVIGSRGLPGPSLVWYRRDTTGWTQLVVENDGLPLEAGGAFHDLDGDGDLDVVGGANNQSNEMWWWENPYPNYADGIDWTRRTIKSNGANKHHDMMFGNFDDDPAVELAYWNQGAKQLFVVDVPADARVEPWPGAVSIFTAPNSNREGLAQVDVDGDGKTDILGGGYWFKHSTGKSYTANEIEQGDVL